MKLKILSILLLLSLSLVAFSQRDGRGVRQDDVLENLKEKEMDGTLTIYLDTLLEENYTKHLIQNSKTRGIAGYRIRIFSDNGRGAKDRQKEARANFLSLYSDVDAYTRYEGSYYKIYIGDFRTKSEAILLLGRIKRKFPDAFVVEDNIVIQE